MITKLKKTIETKRAIQSLMDERMRANNELGRMGKEAVIVQFWMGCFTTLSASLAVYSVGR
jgi:hypothetical protein